MLRLTLPLSRTLVCLPLLALPLAAQAQINVKPDGKFRSLWGVSASVTDGNSRASTLTLTGEAVRQTDYSKWGIAGRSLYTRSGDGETSGTLALGTQYDRDLLNRDYFGFGKLEYLRDRPANIDGRHSAYGGFGRHLLRSEAHTWDAYIGLGYTEDRYVAAASVAGEMRMRYGRSEAVLSEASNHTLTGNTSFRQKIEIYPNLGERGEFRTLIDLGLAVAMTDRMQLTTGLLHRYNSDPGDGLKRSDVQFVTGVSVRFE